ncbi:MAG: hypothetical protein M3O09_07080 [Acidobacteriota bacterium]|jgi:hypothetical protein|nr:hypothetical protein [Acidobacteriota bacterium]
MDTQAAIKIVLALADGLNPATGEALAADSVCLVAENIKALHRAVGALQGLEEREQSKRLLPGNAGKTWTHAEEQQVCDELRRGINFQEIAKAHNRTVVSIVARLVRLGKIAAEASAAKAA